MIAISEFKYVFKDGEVETNGNLVLMIDLAGTCLHRNTWI